MPNFTQFFFKSININFGKFSIPVPYVEVGAIIFLIFLLILSLAQFRRHFVDWSFKGAIFGILFGFLLALTLEGFLIIGGKTALTEVLGWKNAPKPLQVALDSGKSQLIKVLGVSDQIPKSLAKENADISATIEVIQGLNAVDRNKLKTIICKP